MLKPINRFKSFGKDLVERFDRHNSEMSFMQLLGDKLHVHVKKDTLIDVVDITEKARNSELKTINKLCSFCKSLYGNNNKSYFILYLYNAEGYSGATPVKCMRVAEVEVDKKQLNKNMSCAFYYKKDVIKLLKNDYSEWGEVEGTKQVKILVCNAPTIWKNEKYTDFFSIENADRLLKAKVTDTFTNDFREPTYNYRGFQTSRGKYVNGYYNILHASSLLSAYGVPNSYSRTDTMDKLFDKSGYFVELYREKLKERLREYRCSKFENTDVVINKMKEKCEEAINILNSKLNAYQMWKLYYTSTSNLPNKVNQIYITLKKINNNELQVLPINTLIDIYDKVMDSYKNIKEY